MAFHYDENIHLFTVRHCLFDLVALYNAGCLIGAIKSYLV